MIDKPKKSFFLDLSIQIMQQINRVSYHKFISRRYLKCQMELILL